ncbi:MAG: conjugal transfer protein, partial [Mycobacterium sp.]
QVILHVARDQTGRRHLSEVGILQQADDGRVTVLPCWSAETGFGCGAQALDHLIRVRGRT